MEEDTVTILKLSDLISGGRYVAGVSSITPKSSVSGFEWQRYEHLPKPIKQASQTTTSKFLEPLKDPTVLIGTLSLPIHPKNDDFSSSMEMCCFQFSDGFATIYCDVMNFHPRIIGRDVRAFAWNFIPLNDAGCRLSGFLEIISWELLGFPSDSTSFPLALGSSSECTDDSKAKYSLFGVLESISPVTMVPCSVGDSGSKNLCGFLVKILVCDCKLCQSRKGIVAFKDFTEGSCISHCFRKPLIVYFCESAASWHPAIARLVGSVVALSGLRRKLVCTVKDDELMYVTSEKTLFHVPKVVKKGISNQKPVLRGLGEVGSYAGTITGVYMQGMVVELDQELMLLLTDHRLVIPHSLRVGAVVSVRNVHFVNPKFCWTKTLVLGACVITSICIESFSPLEARSYKRSHSQNLLWKFVDSLAFSARLWVLLTVSCFYKKFARILPEKEIIGSKHKIGLAQRYAISCLSASACQKRRGVLMEYCKHSLCNHAEEEDHSPMKLAIPISSFRNYVENRWIKEILDQKNDFTVTSEITQRNYLHCCGRSYAKYIRKIFQSEETAVSLLGYIKFSPSSGRLQLVDASGSIDVIVPDIAPTWDFNRVYEVEDFKIIMLGVCDELKILELFPCEPFTCRSIFEDVRVKRESKLSVSIYHHFRDERSILYSSPGKYSEISFQQFNGGNFHLLWLKHKFPLLHKSLGYQVVLNRSRAFAEVVILPWNFIFPEEIAHPNGVHLEEDDRNSRKYEKRAGLKRCKTDKSSGRKCESRDAGKFKCGCLYNSNFHNFFTERNDRDLSFKFPCLVSSKSFKSPRQGFVHCTDKKAVTGSGFKPDGRLILLEFDSDSLHMYQELRIGAYYMIKDQKNDLRFTVKDDNNVTPAALLVTSETYFWSLSLSSDVVLENSDSSSIFPFEGRHEILPVKHRSVRPEPCCSDINLCVPADIIRYLKIDSNVSESGMLKSSVTFEKDAKIYNGNCPVVTRQLLTSGSSSNLILPEGNLFSLRGHVVAIHDSLGDVHESIFSPGTSTSCIHVLVDNHMAMIFGALGKNIYPTGFGPGVEATFHRILVLGGQNQYMLLSASFIVLDAPGCQYEGERDSASDSVVSQSTTSPCVFPAALISDITHGMDLKPMELHIRVVGIFTIILQKHKKAGYSKTKARFSSSIAEIPLAGFIVDDGSSLCCCWADHERAATILGMPTKSVPSEGRCRASSRTEVPARPEANGFPVDHLDSILRQHHRVIVGNKGSMLDPSSQDFAVSVGKEKPMSGFNENLLKGLILKACFSKLWTVAGSLMDSGAVYRLEKRLRELDMGTAMPPLHNIWLTGVHHCDPLAQSRTLIQELVHS